MNPLDLTREEAQALLTPLRQYTDAEHTAAYWRFVLVCVHDRLSSILFDAEAGRITEIKDVRDRLNSILYNEDDDDRGWAERTIWTGWWSPENIRETAQSGERCGDCTAVPASCMRCIVDDFYGVDTRAWSSKHEGHEIFRRAHGPE